MKSRLMCLLCPLFIYGCNESSVLPSIRDGNNKVVACFFDATSVYKDIVFNVGYDEKNKLPILKFINLDTQKEPMLVARTDSRLSIQFHNSAKEQILLNLFHKTGRFEMLKAGSDSLYGQCEEIK